MGRFSGQLFNNSIKTDIIFPDEWLTLVLKLGYSNAEAFDRICKLNLDLLPPSICYQKNHIHPFLCSCCLMLQNEDEAWDVIFTDRSFSTNCCSLFCFNTPLKIWHSLNPKQEQGYLCLFCSWFKSYSGEFMAWGSLCTKRYLSSTYLSNEFGVAQCPVFLPPQNSCISSDLLVLLSVSNEQKMRRMFE